MRVNLTEHSYEFIFHRHIDCVPDDFSDLSLQHESNTSCSLHGRLHRHDLAQEYAVEPDNYTAIMASKEGRGGWAGIVAQCGVYWRDPMQVSDATECYNQAQLILPVVCT
jgi:hypothetical protein